MLRKGTLCREIKTSRITGHAVFFVEDAYLASAFAKNSHMEQFLNDLYDKHEVFFAWYLSQTPYRYHRIFAAMDEVLRKRAMKALAIITAAKYSNRPALSCYGPGQNRHYVYRFFWDSNANWIGYTCLGMR